MKLAAGNPQTVAAKLFDLAATQRAMLPAEADIDQSLDTEDSKQRFWTSFRVLGDWYDKLPPY